MLHGYCSSVSGVDCTVYAVLLTGMQECHARFGKTKSQSCCAPKKCEAEELKNKQQNCIL